MSISLSWSKQKGFVCVCILSLILLVQGSWAAVPGLVSYQGKILENGQAVTTDGQSPLPMTFRFYDAESDGSLLYEETQEVAVVDGVYSVQLGQNSTGSGEYSTLADAAAHASDIWLEVKINGETLQPRQKFTSTPYAIRAGEADTLDGMTVADLDQSAHVSDTSNPHNVTPAQIGAATITELANHAADASAHHVKTTSFSELTDMAADSQIPDTIARDSEITWGNLANIPSGFADGVDNDSGGDITAVTAGRGLAGGGGSGAVALGIKLPLYLSGYTHSASALLHVNTYDGAAIYGMNQGNFGKLGTTDYGVYGCALGEGSYAGYFDGPVKMLQDTTVLGSMGIGVASSQYRLLIRDDVEGLVYPIKLENHHDGDAPGESDVGILFSSGGSGTTERGKGAIVYQTTGTWNRGSFHFLQDNGANSNNPDLNDSVMTITNSGRVGIGTTQPDTTLDVRNYGGEAWMSLLRGTNQNGGISFKEEGAADTQWIFPYFRGWQSDNLIIRDEASRRDVMTFRADNGNVGIGANPETLLHVSAGTAGDAVLLLEADTDNNNEDDQPSILFRQDGGLITGRVGFIEGSNNLRLKTDEKVQVIVRDDDNKDVLVAEFDENGITHPPKTSFLAIPPAAFRPRVSDTPFGGWVDALWNPSDFTDGEYMAPVYLPHGANVVRVTCWWSDKSAEQDATLELFRDSLNVEDERLMSQMYSTGAGSERHLSYDTTIAYPEISNYEYKYTLNLKIPKESGPDIFFYGARIEYTTTQTQ